MPKPSRSPLYFYARKYQNHYQTTTGQRININEAITACYDDWKALPDEEKNPYKIEYENWRLNYRVNPETINTISTRKGLKTDKILIQNDIPCEELKIHYDRFNFEKLFLSNKYLPLDINELLTMPIYIINFQIFCKIDEEDGGEYLPAEMCILRYTLSEGVTIYRQKFIKPDKIPSGYMSSCIEHLKETHEIPLKDFNEATNDYKKIYQELKSFVCPIIINKTNNIIDNNDERTCRRYLRLTQPCVFFPSLEYDRTSKIIDWLQEKAEGIKPTKDTRIVNLASIESLIMVLADLKKYHVSRDDIQKTFENATYSFMIKERCPYHFQLGISHCSVARCHAAAKLISAYTHQLYVTRKSPSIITDKHSQNSSMNNTNQSSINKISNRIEKSMENRPPFLSSKSVPNHYSSTDTNDSIASSYRPCEQRKQQNFSQSNEQIPKFEKQNFYRSFSNTESLSSLNTDYLSEYTIEDTDQISSYSNTQRKQILLNAIQHIDKQIDELDIQ